MRQSPLDLVPGLREAVEQEQTARDASFFPVTESVGGFECRQMTLQDYLVLKTARNPLLFHQTPSPEELAAFLWLLSPEYRPDNTKGKKRHMRRCRALFIPPVSRSLFSTERAKARHQLKCDRSWQNAARIIESAEAYLAETFQDQSAPARSVGYEPSYYSEGVSVCAQFAREYPGWTEEQILKMPLKRIFQYINEIKLKHGNKGTVANPSDKLIAAWTNSVNKKR